jgi:hypothetical protein
MSYEKRIYPDSRDHKGIWSETVWDILRRHSRGNKDGGDMHSVGAYLICIFWVTTNSNCNTLGDP